jgi:LmbE family N-acetylglucosaminyl deacetylase
MEFVDFSTLRRGPEMGLLFPGWRSGEKVAFLAPHDDDILLGAGYLLTATLAHGGMPIIYIFCSGDAGYSSAREKQTITTVRRKETAEAYGYLGVIQENMDFFEVPDFSLAPQINRRLSGGSGLFEEQIRRFRERQVTRVVFSSGHFEHWDHTAVFQMGLYTSPQAGDPILADLGPPQPIKTLFVYSVWGDFDPALGHSRTIRANKGILVDIPTEMKIRRALEGFASQRRIFQDIVAHREKRKSTYGYLELYQHIPIRPRTDFSPYFDRLAKCRA